MDKSMLEMLLHPVRMRIVQSVLGPRIRTAQQLADELPDVPHATLYRHINRLLQAGVLEVVAENQVRGTIEKVFTLAQFSPDPSKDDLQNVSRDDHMRYFMTFIAGIMDDYQRYLGQKEFDLHADIVSYRKTTVYLTDEEATTLLKTLAAPILKAMENAPTSGRRKRTLSNIFLPEPLSPHNSLVENE